MENVDSINIGTNREQKSQSLELKYAQGKHLKEGISPIMAGIGTPEQFRQYYGKEKEIKDAWLQNFFQNKKNSIRNVDYFGNQDDLKKEGFKSAGRGTYVISPVDNFDKFSESSFYCMGLVATGQDKKTGENISFMSHADPSFYMESEGTKKEFTNDLCQRLKELQEGSADGTIDVVIFGGNYFFEDYYKKKSYVEPIKLLSKAITQSYGFEPLIITGPKIVKKGEITEGKRDKDDVYYDNKHRRIYIMRPEIGKASTESFYPSELESRMKEWDKEL